jgi:hypothetical protein
MTIPTDPALAPLRDRPWKQLHLRRWIPQITSEPAVETRKPKPSDLTYQTPESCLGDPPVETTNWTLANSNFELDTPPCQCVRLVDRKMLTLKGSIVPQSSSTSSRRFATLQTCITELDTMHEWHRVSLAIRHPFCSLLNALMSWIIMKYENDFR